MSVSISCTYTNTGGYPYLLVAFDTSKQPIHVDVNIDAVKVPIAQNAKLLIACLVASYKSDFGQFVNTIEGWVSLPLDSDAIGVPMKHASDPLYISGSLTLRVNDTQKRIQAFDRRELTLLKSKDGLLLDKLCETNMKWYHSESIQPYDEELRHIQIPYLNGLTIPGFCFMMDMPVEPCSNEFYDNAIENILVRRRWSPLMFRSAVIEQRAIVCLEAMQAIANHFLYITDYKIDKRGNKIEVDVFSSIARVISGGDCEDSAKEICMLCHEWQTHTSLRKESLAWYGAKALRHYVCALGLGSVRGPKLGTSASSLLAHAFVMLTPRTRFEAMMQGTTLSLNIPTDNEVVQEEPCMLVGDGTNLKLVDERKSPEPHVGFKTTTDIAKILQKFFNIEKKGDRFKSYGNQGIANEFYVDIVSCMPLGVISTRTKQSVFQVYFSNKKGDVYGAPFAHVNDRSKYASVRIKPTVEPTADDIDVCMRTMRAHGFPPIPAHVFSTEKDRGIESLKRRIMRTYYNARESITIAKLSKEDKKTMGYCLKRVDHINETKNLLNLFLSFDDAFQPDVVEAVRSAAKHPDMDGLYLFPEYFSETSYGILLNVYARV